MMDIFFNELSVPLNAPDIDTLVNNYAITVKEAVNQGFHKVRYEKGITYIMLREDYSLANYIFENANNHSVQVLLSTQAKPYIPDEDESVEPYVMNDYQVANNEQNTHSDGIIAAALAGSMAIGFKNSQWTESSYNVTETSVNGIKTFNVLYAFSPDYFRSIDFQNWADYNLPPEILPSNIPCDKKKIHLSDHHGKDVLYTLAKRLVREDYVTEIINSIDRNSYEHNFISQIDGNLIYITLVKQDYFGLVIATTARNDRELRYIARIIEEKYNK